MSAAEIANLIALIIVNVCGYASLAPRLKRLEEKLDGKLDATAHAEVHKETDKRIDALERVA